MLNRLIKFKEPETEQKAGAYQPSMMDSSHFRIIMRQSVLTLSLLLTFGSIINMINRNEVHGSMWLSVGVSIFFLAVAAQVTVSSRHLMTTLNILIIAMLLNIHIQVLHGISPLIVWSIPFYLIWILIYPTVLVAIVGCLLTGTFIHFSPDHPVIGANWMLALTTACVAHFAKQALREQLQLAASDSLTGALNRRYLASQLETRRADFVRNQRVSSLVLNDVDGLKALNDRFGHKTGDEVLKAVVDITLQRIRGSDSLFRIGGDEFALILADAKSHDALTVSNDIRRLLREHVSSDRPPFSVSFGVCCVDETASQDDWLARADEALYEAKRGGGDVARMAA